MRAESQTFIFDSVKIFKGRAGIFKITENQDRSGV